VRVSSLGDVVHNMPVIADIRRRHPEAQIDWLVEESFVGLVQLVSGVRRAIPVSLRRWRKRICRSTTGARSARFAARSPPRTTTS
jgi:ADP-heptose:LPS heptosyltransferase